MKNKDIDSDRQKNGKDNESNINNNNKIYIHLN